MMQVLPVLRWWRNNAALSIRRRYVSINLSIALFFLQAHNYFFLLFGPSVNLSG